MEAAYPIQPELDRTFAALAHPVRRAMLLRLAAGPASPSELGAPFRMSQPAISRHLHVLEEAGLITRERSAQWRPCVLHKDPLLEADSWLMEFRRSWEERLDRLDGYIEHLHETSSDIMQKEREDGREHTNG